MALLELRDVEKAFRNGEVETHALSGIQLDVARGEWLAVVGPSGSGKTTLLAILGLLDLPTRGAFRLDGADVAALSPRELARLRNANIGFVFQSFNLIAELTVFDNVELPLVYRGLAPAARRARVDEALARVGMGNRARHFPAQLSGGQQQRVAVARAVAGHPPILLADEPTGNLDSRNGQAVLKLLAGLHQEGSTVIMVTHDAGLARFAQRSITLFDGRIVEER